MTYLHKIAPTDSTVLVTGETGTGKELVAELIHCNSPRATQPFVCVNCAALPGNLVESELFGFDRGAFTGAVTDKKGKFELADGGTVLLDEIGDMNLNAQAKILRSIEQKEVYPLGGKKAVPLDVRVIAATHQDLEQLFSAGKFREDLYYRLNVVPIHLPSLRERKEDIPILAAFAINKLNQRYNHNIQGLTDEALANLMRYDWPGNIRELLNLLEATYVNPHGKKIRLADLPPVFRKKLKEGRPSAGSERNYIVSSLISTNWRKSFPENIQFERGFDLPEMLGKFELAGGSIINVIHHACLKMLGRGPERIILLKEVLQGIRREVEKEGKVFKNVLSDML